MDNYRILKYLPSEDSVSLFAGNSINSYLENVPATSASFGAVVALWGNTRGVIFVVDQGNNRIRKVDNGTVSLVAGTGFSSSFVDNVVATSATLNSPSGIWVSSRLCCWSLYLLLLF
jgi:hypothetical protein